MCSLQLILGWQPLLTAEPAALPAIVGICRALRLPTRWNEEWATLYIASPFPGKRVLLLVEPEPGQEVDQAVGAELQELLSRAGAQATVSESVEQAPACDLVLRLRAASRGQCGVSVIYPWLHWQDGRRLAALLTGEIARTANIPDLGARAALRTEHHAGEPVVEVRLGAGEVTDVSLPELVALGLYRGLGRYWTPQQLEQVLGAVEPAPEPEPDPEPEPVLELEPELEPDLEGEPEIHAPETEAVFARLHSAPRKRAVRYDPRIVPGHSPVHVFRRQQASSTVPLSEPEPKPVPAPSPLDAFFQQVQAEPRAEPPAPKPPAQAVAKRFERPSGSSPRHTFQVIQHGGTVIRFP